MRLAGAAFLYFAIVFGTGYLLGPIRILLVEPVVGPVAALAVEAPFLLIAMIFAARFAPRVARLNLHAGSLLGCGAIALTMQQLADLAVGFVLRGVGFGAQLARLATAEGPIYLALLALFMLMPWLVHRRRMPIAPG